MSEVSFTGRVAVVPLAQLLLPSNAIRISIAFCMRHAEGSKCLMEFK